MTKDFDAVAWMRARREAIDLEDGNLTWEEKSRRTMELLKDDPLWNRLKNASSGAGAIAKMEVPIKPGG